MFLVIIALVAVALLRSGRRWVEVSERYHLLGTLVEIKIPCLASQEESARAAIQAARDKIAHIESLMSPYNSESDVAHINLNAAKHPVRVSNETFGVIEHALAISRLADGAFDITFAPVGKLWRLDPKNAHIPTDEEIRAKLLLVNFRNISLEEKSKTVAFRKAGMEIGLGGIAKGTAVDMAARAIRKCGFPDAIVNVGGDLYAMGLSAERKPWRVGILDPRKTSEFVTTLEVSNRAVVTSGDYERMVVVDGKRYHHIMDPRTGRPAEKCASVTVVAGDTETADALATAIFVLGPKAGLKLARKIPDTEALIITPGLRMYATKSFGIPPGKTCR